MYISFCVNLSYMDMLPKCLANGHLLMAKLQLSPYATETSFVSNSGIMFVHYTTSYIYRLFVISVKLYLSSFLFLKFCRFVKSWQSCYVRLIKIIINSYSKQSRESFLFVKILQFAPIKYSLWNSSR